MPPVARVAPYGTWPSPLSVDDVAAGRISRSSLRSDGRYLYWLENVCTLVYYNNTLIYHTHLLYDHDCDVCDNSIHDCIPL